MSSKPHIEPEYPYWWNGYYLTKLQLHHTEPKLNQLIFSKPDVCKKFTEKNMDLRQTLKEVVKEVFLHENEDREMVPYAEIYLQIIEKLRGRLGMEYPTAKLQELIVKEFEQFEREPTDKVLLYKLREFMEEKNPKTPDELWLKCFEPVMVDAGDLYQTVMLALETIIKGDAEKEAKEPEPVDPLSVPVAKRKPGRPRKHPVALPPQKPVEQVPAPSAPLEAENEAAPKKTRVFTANRGTQPLTEEEEEKVNNFILENPQHIRNRAQKHAEKVVEVLELQPEQRRAVQRLIENMAMAMEQEEAMENGDEDF